ncbi:hypothetical protein VCV18_004840 [Metarhizium anisopliae]
MPNSTPFQRHYLGREIGADTWAILRRQKPQQALIMQACSVSHSISKRRPTDLTPEQLVSVNNDALIKRLERDLRRHRQGSKKYMELRRELRNEKQRLKRQLKQKVRDETTAEQAVDDIERQLRGVGFAKGAANATVSPQRPAQKRLMEALTAPLGNTLEGQYRRRDNAISAIMAYCVVEEGQTIRRPTSSVESRSTLISEPPVRSPQHMALVSVFVKNEKYRPRRCFICVGKALGLAPNDPAMTTLTRQFYTPGDLNKHFRRSHLSNMQKDKKIECPACSIPLEHKQHLLAHAQIVHGIHLRHQQHVEADGVAF